MSPATKTKLANSRNEAVKKKKKKTPAEKLELLNLEARIPTTTCKISPYMRVVWGENCTYWILKRVCDSPKELKMREFEKKEIDIPKARVS